MKDFNFFAELTRIAESVPEKDAEILRAAAFKLIPGPEPTRQQVTNVPGVGYLMIEQYSAN